MPAREDSFAVQFGLGKLKESLELANFAKDLCLCMHIRRGTNKLTSVCALPSLF